MKGGPYPVPMRYRFDGDGLKNQTEADVIGCSWIRLPSDGTNANEAFDLTWYKYGAMVAFRSPARGAGGTLSAVEFHGWRPDLNDYSACATFETASNNNRLQLRNLDDTNGLGLQCVTSGFGLYTESAAGTGTSFYLGIGSVPNAQLIDGAFRINSDHYFAWSTADVDTATDNARLYSPSAGVLSLRQADTAQAFRVYGATTGDKYVSLAHDGTNSTISTSSGQIIVQAAGGALILGANATNYWEVDSIGLLALTDNTYSLGQTDANRPSQLFLGAPKITKGSGTGFTLNDSGSVRRQTYKCTTTFAAYAAAATTGDKVIGTLPAKARIVAIYADTTTKYIGGAVATCTLRLGTTAGGVEVLASHDVFTAAVTKGLLDADLGTSMVRASAIQGGYMPSFTGTTSLTARITTTGANTNALTQGSTTWYIETEVLP